MPFDMELKIPTLQIGGIDYQDTDQYKDEDGTNMKGGDDSLSMAGNLEELHLLLREDSVTHSDSRVDSFWPEKRLRSIMTQERILKRIKANDATAIPREKVDEKLEEIRTKYMKVFAILTFMEMDEHIMMLIDAKLDDASLPLVKADVANSRSQCIIAFKDPERPRPGCFKGWKICFRESFLACQYRFSPIMLGFQPGTRDVRHVDLDDAAVLPFTQSRAIRDGGFGSVIEVEVDPDCHGFQSALQSIIIDNKFAVKTLLYDSTNEEFRKEVDALKRFNGFVHDHLVTLLMTWTRQKQYSFLFPLAGCNLEDFWINHPPSVVQNSIHVPTVQWISKQILGLTSAIHTVHNPSSLPDHAKKYGRHGDIKPENVLWYRSPQDPDGILVIADLGLSTLNSEESRSNIPNKGIPFTPGYRPPECDLEGGTISRAYDMWTFGCLLLELVSWALGGNSSRVAFEKARMAPYITGSKSDIFFDVKTHRDGPGYVILVKESVSQWICSLHQMSTCTRYFHDLLDLIENGMVVMLSREQARYPSSKVLAQIEEMHRKVMEPSNEYCRKSTPDIRTPNFCVPMEARLNATAKGEIATRKPQLNVYGGKETRRPQTKAQLSNLS